MLDLPEVVERQHMGHPDFRVPGKVVASLGYPGPGWAMVQLPETFIPAAGAWGRNGCTNVRLRSARKRVPREALATAWRTHGPRRLVHQHENAAS